jgi:uncharacterized protein YueI
MKDNIIEREEQLTIQDQFHQRDIAQAKFFNRQAEKYEYLGEYRERVIVALTKDQAIQEPYREMIDAIANDKRGYLLKMAREVPITNLKPYIEMAEKHSVKFELVDGISYVGEIGIVLVAKDAVEPAIENPLVKDRNQGFIDHGLNQFIGKKGMAICKECFEILEDELPEKMKEFKHMGLKDTFLGRRCPVCKK